MTAAAVPVGLGVEAAEVAQRRWIKWQAYLSFVALGAGGLMGLLQAFERLGLNLYDESQLQSYYQGLTIHGVALAIAFTFTFSNAFLSLAVSRGLKRPLASTGLTAASFITAGLGVVLALGAMLTNSATVLYTFYAPLEASTLFYLGAVLLVVSTWLVSANQLLTLRAWRADNPGQRIPLVAFVSIITYLMWDLASVGIAVQTLGLLIPLSMGWASGTDPLLSRTLFWFTGHPIVYFWLLPAYVSWYMLVPKRVGGKLLSDRIVRGVFILFLLLSTPVGLHHQFTDPGVSANMKFIHGVLTFAVFFPSMVTAFTLISAFESGGRARGGKGLLGWIPKLPWSDPVVTPQILAMLLFTLGGVSGLINASYTVNLVVHNTSYIPGHFHMTVGSAVALSFMAISYWLVPHLTGKRLYSAKLAVTQGWIYFAGVLMYSRGAMAAGLEGQPRRIPVNSAPYADGGWSHSYDSLAGLGGLFMVTAGILFFVIIIGTLLNKKEATSEELAFDTSEVSYGPEPADSVFDRLGLWFGVAVALVVVSYLPALIGQGIDLNAPGFSNLW